jgi:hypothetical protein
MKKKIDKRRFVRYDEACAIYGMGLTKLKEIANAAEAKYKLNRMVLISLDKIDAYIETFLKTD